MNLTNEDVLDILHLLDASPYDELHLETDRFRLSIRRTAAGEWSQAMQVLSSPNLVAAELSPAQNTVEGPPEPAEPRNVRALEAGEALTELRAPLPGLFYRAPKPGEAPFVEVGSHVHPDTVVAIIETMKLMNSVTADSRGTIAEICLNDAQFAAQDVVLMRIAPMAT